MGLAARLLKRLLQAPADALIASSTKLPQIISERTRSDPRLCAKFYPYQADRTFYFLEKSRGLTREHGGLPMPPKRLWMGYGETAEEFLQSGKLHADKMKELLALSNFQLGDGNRVLDVGCASGRMIRWFNQFAERCEIWGVDISADHIIWCQQHLSPPFRFATITTTPHLPFEDRYFDLIYCGSVFTHIDDLADAWLLELKRVVRPEGRLYITIHDRNTLQLVLNQPWDWWFKRMLRSYDEKEKIGSLDFAMFTIGRGASSQVFYDIDYLKEHWGRILNILSITPEAYSHQTALVLGR